MMKKALLYNLILAGILSLASCSEKFDVAAPYKNVTIVTGFLDMGDTAQYIRIEKGFLDNDKSAIDMAGVADSSYYDSIDVKIKELLPPNTIPVNIYTLPLVDMDKEGYPKAGGAFFTTPNLAYKFKQILNPQHRYRLVITNFRTGEVDSAETGLIDTSLNHFSITEVLAPTIKLSKKDASGKVFLSGNIIGASDDSMQTPQGAKVLECAIRFYYKDSFATGEIVLHQLDWTNVPITTSPLSSVSNSYTLTIPNTSFYDFFQANIPASEGPNIEFRKIDSMLITIYAGSKDYDTYKNVTGAQAGSLTGGEIKPNYSNIKGGTVLGLYTTRAKREGRGFKLEVSPTIDSLRADPRTSAINFVRP